MCIEAVKETWKSVPNYEGLYEVSDLGRVRSLDRMINCRGNGKRLLKGKVMKFDLNQGYHYINLYLNSKCNKFRVHRLIMLVFIGKSYLCVNHINGIKIDNRLVNLEYCTSKQNTQHAYKTGLIKPLSGENNNNTKLTRLKVLSILKEYNEETISQKELSKKYLVNKTTINRILNGKIWKEVYEDFNNYHTI